MRETKDALLATDLGTLQLELRRIEPPNKTSVIQCATRSIYSPAARDGRLRRQPQGRLDLVGTWHRRAVSEGAAITKGVLIA